MIRLRDYVILNDKEYFVSTKNTYDVGLETMVFESSNKTVVKWSELYYRHYKNENDAYKGHFDIVNNLEKYLEEGKNQCWQEDTGIDPFDILSSILNKFKLYEE